MVVFSEQCFRGHVVRPIAVKLDYDSIIHFLEFSAEKNPGRLEIVKSASYRLVMSEQQRALFAAKKVPALPIESEEP